MSTSLHQEMERAVGSLEPDLDRLTTASRRQGLAIRRRRQALSVVGVAAAVGVVVAAAAVVPGVSGDSGRTPAPVASGPAGPAPAESPAIDPTRTGPLTGRGTVALLQFGLDKVAHGHATHYAGQGSGRGGDAGSGSYGTFQWTPADGSPATQVMANVQPGFAEGKEIFDCANARYEQCRIRTLADGTILLRYQVTSQTPEGLAVDRTVDSLRPDKLRIVVSTTNREVVEKGKVVRDKPPLTAAQLQAVVLQTWWGPELPTYFLRLGDRLPSYDDIASTP